MPYLNCGTSVNTMKCAFYAVERAIANCTSFVPFVPFVANPISRLASCLLPLPSYLLPLPSYLSRLASPRSTVALVIRRIPVPLIRSRIAITSP